MVEGVTKGYEKRLEIVGVGYRAAMQGSRPRAGAGLLALGGRSRLRTASSSRCRPDPDHGPRHRQAARRRDRRARSASSASPSRTRARASGTRASTCARRPARPRREARRCEPRSSASTACAGTAACAKSVRGTAERPRLAVYRSNRHIYAQLIDDASARTLASASDLWEALPADKEDRAKRVGSGPGRTSQGRRSHQAVFDRGGRLYHGRVKAARGRAPVREDSQFEALRQPGRDRAPSRSGWSRSTGSPRSSRAAAGSASPRSSWWATAPAGSGVGYGKAKEVPAAIQKGVEEAKKSMFQVPLMNTTIPHEVIGEDGAGRGPAQARRPGTGVIAGGPVRAVVEAAGIKDILSKSLGSGNPINIVHAATAGLRMLAPAGGDRRPAGPGAGTSRAPGHGRGRRRAPSWPWPPSARPSVEGSPDGRRCLRSPRSGA